MDIRNLHQNGSWNAPYLPVWRPEDGSHPRKRPRSPCFEALLALLMLMMVACTAVKDPSERWKTSGMDPKLEGEWKMVKKNTQDGGDDFDFVKSKNGDWYVLDAEEKDFAMRTFTAGNRRFLLFVNGKAAAEGFDKVDAEKRGGFVWFYEIDGDTLRLSMLKDTAVAKAIAAGRIKGECANPDAKEPEPRIATLDDATCAELGKLAEDKDAWARTAEYKREPKK